MSFEEDLSKMIRSNEGVRTKVYKDTLGIDTIGVGFNLERGDAQGIVEALGINYGDLRTGKVALTNAQVDALLLKDILAVEDDLKTLFPNWDTMPAGAKMVLCDMRFQLGATGLRAFKNTLKSFQIGNWKSAAAGMRLSKAYQQATKRWEKNATSLESL